MVTNHYIIFITSKIAGITSVFDPFMTLTALEGAENHR
jgi:hypothetical protein